MADDDFEVGKAEKAKKKKGKAKKKKKKKGKEGDTKKKEGWKKKGRG
mgnify:CR=1 FL=1